MAHHEYFPESVIQLREEINKHPALVALINSAKDAGNIEGTLDVVLHAAAYVNIEVDGYFNEADMLKLVDEIIVRLKAKEVVYVH